MKPSLAQENLVILHVDDNEDARTSLAWILHANGFQTLQAATGAEALRLVREQPALVLLDVGLPDASGSDICRAIKADPVTAHIPVLMMTGRIVSGGPSSWP
jgi:CheY-like chemotaxis protein